LYQQDIIDKEILPNNFFNDFNNSNNDFEPEPSVLNQLKSLISNQSEPLILNQLKSSISN
ncbi:4007_t:CDS:1, partial [Racocetra persica]